MIRNYIKTAWRNLLNQKGLSFINVLGLSIGLACFSLFLLFAVNQLSYDRFHKKSDNIYRVAEWIEGIPGREPGGEAYGGTPLAPAMKKDFPDVADAVRIQKGFQDNFVKADQSVYREGITYADEGFFSVFSFPLIAGKTDVLKDPHAVVLTRSKALTLFGKTDIIGKRLEIKTGENFELFVVGAIAEDIPPNSSIQFGILGSFSYLLSTDMGKQSLSRWSIQIGCETYVLLKEGSRLAGDRAQLTAFRRQYYPEEGDQMKERGTWDGKSPYPVSFRLQPLRDVHTNTSIDGIASGMDPKYIWILIAIAAGILLIACINFTTLAIGRSAGRAREVGVRKVMGGLKSQLIGQFLTESLMLTLISAIIAWLLAGWLLPWFNQLSGVKLSFDFSTYPELYWLFASLILLTGLLAGVYPSFILSRFQAIQVLKNKIRLGGSNYFTRSLVTVQFVLSITLIISTLVILDQMKYMREKDLGLSDENVIAIDASGLNSEKIYPLFKQMLNAQSGITAVSASEMGLGEGNGMMGTGFRYNGEVKGVILYPVDAGFLDMMNIPLISGRNFDPKLSIDTVSSVVVNEALLRDFGLTPDNAIGYTLQEKQFEGPDKQRVIIGVARNFHFASLTQHIRPQLFYQPATIQPRKIFVRTTAGNPTPALEAITAAWKKLAPGLTLQYSFLDEDFDRFYKWEEKWSRIIGSAGAISIFLACLGLLGLAALAAVNRTREIGIRKVMGASLFTITGLLTRDFLKLVTIAFVIAAPLTWLGMNRWLQEYAYRIELSWIIFLLAGLGVALLAFLTIGFHALKTGTASPVKSLRTE